MELVFYVKTQKYPYFSISEELRRFHLFSCSGVQAFGVWKLHLRGFSTAVRKTSIFSDPCFAVLIPNVGFKPVFKPVAINIEFSSSFNSFILVLVDYFWSRQNSFHLTTFLNLLIAMSMSAWTYFQDGSGTNRSEVPLQTCWTSSRRFSILDAWASPWAIKKYDFD